MKMKSFFISAGLLCTMSFLAFANSKTDMSSSLPVTGNAVPTEDAEKSMPASTLSEDIADPFNNGAEDAVQENFAASVEAGSQSTIDPVLQGLAIGPTKAIAVISDKTYVQGDGAQNGIEVVEVRKKEADIKVEGIKRTIRLVPEFKKIKKLDPVMAHTSDAVTPKSESSFLAAAGDAAMSGELLTEKSESEQDSLLAAKEESK